MIDLMLAAAMLQPQVDRCHVVGVAPPAGCPVWRSLHRDNQAELFSDPASVRVDGESFEVRIRVLFARAAGDGARTMVLDQRYDCRARTAALKSLYSYDENGRMVQNLVILRNAMRPQPAAPGSPEAFILNTACRGRPTTP